MPALVDKLVIDHGLLTDIEASYGGGGSPAGATDAILLEEPVEVSLQYGNTGDRTPGLGAGGLIQRAAPTGRHGSFTVPVLGRGLGSAYTAGTDEVPDLQDLLRMCGHDAARSGTTPNTKWDFTPNTTNTDSGVLEAYGRGERFVATGAMGSMNFTLEGYWRFDFDLLATFAQPTEVALPALTVNASLIPPKAENISLSFFGETALVCRRIEFAQNRTLANRLNLNAAEGHEGVQGTRRAPRVTLLLEQPAFSKLNLWNLWETAAQGALSFAVDGGTANKLAFSAPQVSISEPPTLEEEDDIAMMSVVVECLQTAPGADDDYTLTFDE